MTDLSVVDFGRNGHKNKHKQKQKKKWKNENVFSCSINNKFIRAFFGETDSRQQREQRENGRISSSCISCKFDWMFWLNKLNCIVNDSCWHVIFYSSHQIKIKSNEIWCSLKTIFDFSMPEKLFFDSNINRFLRRRRRLWSLLRKRNIIKGRSES